MLFSTLDHFDLATAFECCRIDYGASSTPYDRSGFMLGWEMQTGVMAYRRSSRVDAFWQATMKEYEVCVWGGGFGQRMLRPPPIAAC